MVQTDGKPVLAMWRRCYLPGAGATGISLYIDHYFKSCMLNCLKGVINTVCQLDDFNGWAYRAPTDSSCANQCGAVRKTVQIRRSNNELNFVNIFSKPEPLGRLRFDFGNDKIYETLDEEPVHVMRRVCDTPGFGSLSRQLYVHSYYKSCLIKCLSSLQNKPCQRQKTIQWGYESPTDVECLTECGATRKGIRVQDIVSKAKRTIAYYTISQTPSPSPSPAAFTVDISYEASNSFMETTDGSPIPAVYRKCKHYSGISFNLWNYVDASFKTCILNCMDHLRGKPCLPSERSTFVTNTPTTHQCAISCGAVEEKIIAKNIFYNRREEITFYGKRISKNGNLVPLIQK